MIRTILIPGVILCAMITAFAAQPDLKASVEKLQKELTAKYGDAQSARIQKGIRQAADFWRAEDGDAAAFEEMVRTYFIADSKALDQTFERFEFAMEQLNGHSNEIEREFRRQADLDLGPMLPIDDIMAAYSPRVHVTEDFFKNRLAFIALLNFPITTLEERLKDGEKWSRRQWAETQLASQFSSRLPAEINQQINEADAAAEKYISEYNIWMHHLMNEKGERLFPPKLRLISHWNLRDELRGNYSETNGVPKQQMIAKVMEHIVLQTIPKVVIDNPHVDWKPESNTVTKAAANDAESPAPPDLKITADPEPNTRYDLLLKKFRSQKKADPYFPSAPTAIERSFQIDKQLPETRTTEMLKQVLSSPLAAKVAKIVEKRLSRPLEPFDIWYSGFRARGKYTETELDEITRKKYPNAAAFASDIPNILQRLGFSKERSEYLAARIEVDPSRGAGHAYPAQRRGDKPHLRTRVEKDGMNYKGYNIAVHELGHNIEQVFSLYDVDHTLLAGVPNTAFTEALAFVFQAHDIELLGLASPDAAGKAMNTLNDFWQAYEMSGVALVDIAVWHWMYDHPDATPQALRDATVQISRDIWNQYYAPVFGKKDVVLLGVYSHMIMRTIYLPNYPIGRLIAFQVSEQMERSGSIGPEFERITKFGSLTPDLWMKNATERPVGSEALLRATEKALSQF